MIDLDLYIKIFEKYAFEIHEAYDTKKWGKLKNLLTDIKEFFPIQDKDIIKYTTSLGYEIKCRVRPEDGYNINKKEIIFRIKDEELNSVIVNEIIYLGKLEKKYY